MQLQFALFCNYSANGWRLFMSGLHYNPKEHSTCNAISEATSSPMIPPSDRNKIWTSKIPCWVRRISSLAWPRKARRTSARTAWRRSSDLLQDSIFHSKKAWLQQHLPLSFACLQYIKKCLKYLLLWSHASPTRSTHHPPSWCSVPAKRKYRYLMLSSCLSYFREHPFGIHLQIVDGRTWTDYLDFSCAE